MPVTAIEGTQKISGCTVPSSGGFGDIVGPLYPRPWLTSGQP
jgi:hypothetical protein